MKVEIVSTQTIRPAESPSPAAKKSFTLSIFDQLMPDVDIPTILFYNASTRDEISVKEASDILKKSLSETLTHYFPLVGRITDNIRIDEAGPAAGGIEFTEARVRGELRDILSPPNMETIGKLIPALVINTRDHRPLLAVRQSVFECGGMSVGICFSHKVVDGATICWFLRSWSAIARAGGSGMAAAPYLISSASRFPPSDALATTFGALPKLSNLTSRRFVLSGSQIASLKARSCSQSVPHPTRVAAVISLIWQCAMRSYASSKSNNNSPSSSSSGLWQFVNLRNRIDPPLPDSSFGNVIGSFRVSAEEEEEKPDLPSLVARITHAKEEYLRDYPKKLDQASCDQLLSVVSESSNQGAIDLADENANTYFFSSVCKLDLYGAADFGWGKPIWATFCSNYMNYSKFVVLSDTRDEEGIQVWLNLPKHQMDVFEKDPLFLSFATPNPNIQLFDHHHQMTTPQCLFSGPAATSRFHCPSRQLLSRPSSVSHLLSHVRHHYSPRPPCIHSRTIPPPRSIRFISSLLQFHRKLK